MVRNVIILSMTYKINANYGTPVRFIGVLLLLVLWVPLICFRCSEKADATRAFEKDYLLAWCIVPFDAEKRGPEERAAMLKDLGITMLAYDWRNEHIPTFDEELAALKRHNISLTGFWIMAGKDPQQARVLQASGDLETALEIWRNLADGDDRVAVWVEDRVRVTAPDAGGEPVPDAPPM